MKKTSADGVSLYMRSLIGKGINFINAFLVGKYEHFPNK